MIPDSVVYWGCAVIGVLGSAMCSGTEIGLYSLNRVKLNIRVAGAPGGAGANRAARLLKAEIDQPERMIATLLIANTVFGSLLATGIGELLTEAGWSEVAVILLNVAILTPVLVIFGEILPKELFRADADRLTYRFATFVTVARLLLTWIGVIPVILALVNFVSRRLGLAPDARLGSARERMAALLKEGAQHGVLSESQTTLVDRALTLRHTKVADEMQPWAKVRAIPERLDRARVLLFIQQFPYSRFPLVDGLGRVIGTVEHLDICLNPGRSLRDLARPAAFLPPDLPVREALVQLGRAGTRMAVVQQSGEQGTAAGGGPAGRGPLGIVTAKDLIEPLTGELAAW